MFLCIYEIVYKCRGDEAFELSNYIYNTPVGRRSTEVAFVLARIFWGLRISRAICGGGELQESSLLSIIQCIQLYCTKCQLHPLHALARCDESNLIRWFSIQFEIWLKSKAIRMRDSIKSLQLLQINYIYLLLLIVLLKKKTLWSVYNNAKMTANFQELQITIVRARQFNELKKFVVGVFFIFIIWFDQSNARI